MASLIEKFLPRDPEARRAVKAAAAASGLVSLVGFATAFASRAVYDHVLPNHAVHSLVAVSAVMAVALGMDWALRSARSKAVEAVARFEEASDGVEVVAKLLESEGGRIDGHAAMSAQRLKDSVREMRSSAVVFGVVDLPFALVAVALTFVVAGPLGMVPLAFGAANLAAGVAGYRRIVAAAAKSSKESSFRNRMTDEAVSAMDTLKTLDAGAEVVARMRAAAEAAAASSSEVRMAGQAGVAFGAWSSAAAGFAVIAFGAPMTFDGTLTGGAMLAASILAGKATGPFLSAAAVASRIGHGLAALKELETFDSLVPEAPEHPVEIAGPKGGVSFERVVFSYAGTETRALDLLDLRIEPGERVAIVGANGVGKSTCGRLLAGLERPDEGLVRLDGVSVRHLDPSRLRRLVGYLPQRPGFLPGTLLENVLLGNPDVDKGRLNTLATALGISEWVAADPRGVGMPIVPHFAGGGTSEGKLQQLANLRHFLRDPVVSYMDEPTSHLDPETERRWIGVYREWSKGRTCILVTHKTYLCFPEAGLVDRVVALGRGREGGTVARSMAPAEYRQALTGKVAKAA